MLIDIRYCGGGRLYNKGGRIPYRYQVPGGGHSIIKGVMFHTKFIN